jgi:hypothetical protein
LVSEVSEADEFNETGEVSKAWNITTEDIRVFQVLELNNLRTNNTFFGCFENFFFDRIMKTYVEFWHLFCQRPLRPSEVKKVSNCGSGINFHYSGSH